jgi:diguanylate cyclase (GGDEF)-like protein
MAEHDGDRKPVILVVDDEASTRLLVRGSLENAGFVLQECTSGEEAIEAFPRLAVDLLLLDVMMDGMDGFAACEAIRALPGGQDIPVVFMTGLDDVESIARAYKAGATDFITKPISWLLLGHRIAYILRASAALGDVTRSERKTRAILNAIPDSMLHLRHDGTVLDLKLAEGKSHWVTERGADRTRLHSVLPSGIAEQILGLTADVLRTGAAREFEWQWSANGDEHHYETRIVRSDDQDALVIIRDVSDRRKAEAEIARLAFYDTLTGLPNRLLFRDRLKQAILEARRYNRQVALLFLDLDRFKRINDTLGHSVGDRLLIAVAERVTSALRRSDTVGRIGTNPEGITVARQGGDEFTIMVTHIDGAPQVSRIASRLLTSLAVPFNIEEHEIFISGSIGIALYPLDGSDTETMQKNADTAMYEAKEHGRNTFQFYTQSMNSMAVQRLLIENHLNKAIEKDQLLLYYQPQVHIPSGCISGFEALIRWQHTDLGLVVPGEFISLAEESGLIVSIGEWVIREACRQGVAWRRQGLPSMRISVNLSTYQLRDPHLAGIIERALRMHGMDPGCLELEITEGAIMKNLEGALVTLNQIRELGVTISIDDFGTGYSSLAQLKRFPVDRLKIDRSFIKDIPQSTDDQAITKVIILIGHNLDMKVLAEGVETPAQLEYLQESECDEFQGYLFSPPLPAVAVPEFLMSPPKIASLGQSHSTDTGM